MKLDWFDWKKIRQFDWKYVLIEMLIIFTGVYGAFVLNSYRQQNQQQEAQLKFMYSFRADLKKMNQQTARLIKGVQSTIKQVKQSKPGDLPYNRRLALPNSLLIIKAAYKGKNFEALETSFLVSMEFGANLIKLIEKRFNILDEEVRTFILYKEDNAKSFSEFKKWYIAELNFIMSRLQMLNKAIDEGALPATQRIIKRLE